MRQHHRQRARGEPRVAGIGPAGQHDGHPSPKRDARRIGAAEILKLLGQHVAAFEIGDDKDVRPPGHRR